MCGEERTMKKTLMPLLIAAAVALSACGQDLSGGD